MIGCVCAGLYDRYEGAGTKGAAMIHRINMASRKKAGNGVQEKGANGKQLAKHKDGPIVMDTKAVFAAVYEVCEENAGFFSGTHAGDAPQRLVDAMLTIQKHARSLEPVISGFAAIYHHFDFDPHIPANGYRSLVKVVRCCLLHIIYKARHIASNRRSIFFRAAHHAAEMEAYSCALCQLRALLYLAQRLLHDNSHGNLFFKDENGLSQLFLKEYASMHKGCFYGRCVGFQFTPAIRPHLQSITIGLVAFGDNYKRYHSSIGLAASSLFTSGKYALDPELRGLEYERITQNLDVHFWKTFWNITESEVLAGLASMTSTQVKVNRTLSVPPDCFDLPLVDDPTHTVTISAPIAHIGPGPVQMRLISSELREGQDNEKLSAISRSDGGSISLSLKIKKSPPSPWLVVHYHGGGFVAQTSKSHEPYLKCWSQELNAPILSVDYSLAPEAPFPRALEECFFAYCWAIKNHNILGWTGERVCLAGDSAGGNLCITVSMMAVAHRVRLPDGIMTAYPAFMLTTCASPSRLLTLMDPLLPLSVLSRCLNAYAGLDPQEEEQVEKVTALGTVRKDTSLLFKGFRQGASNWIHSLLDHSKASAETVRNSVSEGALSSTQPDPLVPGTSSEFSVKKESLKSHTFEGLVSHTASKSTSSKHNSTSSTANHSANLTLHYHPILNTTEILESKPEDISILFSKEEDPFVSSSILSVAVPPPDGDEHSENPQGFPGDFEPLRSEQLAKMNVDSSPIFRNPFMSPLLAPDHMLKGLPPVHIVACALDPMLDDSVMFARRLRNIQQPVTLCVVDDLPHGFLSLSQLSKETHEASIVCMERIKDVFIRKDQPPEINKHRKLERTDHCASGASKKLFQTTTSEDGREGVV
ncbi:hormone-sensitive lipase isoform X2 [Tachysurus fulvidraco]|uniref:hormone-sensitive lipase isoform X2 n=1 Tax=Tachysurus fulvidraco TaxID=1234273 RepID=UPI000F4DD2D5|nr:hormone-sensitive lipase isoform X2 [Tachysurus fulvidraco]